MQQSLTIEQLPSAVLAEHAHARVSNKYQFLSTLEVVNALGEYGLAPYRAITNGTRIEGRSDFAKHMVRFRQVGQTAMVGDVYPEIVLINSHDRASSFHIELGLFRLVCANGLVVSNGNLAGYRVRHVGSTIKDVLKATLELVQQFPYVQENVERMQSKQLTDTQREHMAALAMGLRWDASKVPFEAARLLIANRAEDTGTDLWSTYNVIQENMIRGQHRPRYGRFNNGGIRTTREVKSIDVDMSINRGLWQLASSMA